MNWTTLFNILASLVNHGRRPGSDAEYVVVPKDSAVTAIPWSPPAPDAAHNRSAIYDLADLFASADKGSTLYVNAQGVEAVWDQDDWRYHSETLPLTPSKPWQDWTGRALRFEPRDLVMWLMKHRAQLVDDAVIADFRSLRVNSTGKLEMDTDESGVMRHVQIVKGKEIASAIPSKLRAEVRPWIGLPNEVAVELEYLVQVDADSTPPVVTLVLVTDLEEAVQVALRQVRALCVAAGFPSYLGTFRLDVG